MDAKSQGKVWGWEGVVFGGRLARRLESRCVVWVTIGAAVDDGSP